MKIPAAPGSSLVSRSRDRGLPRALPFDSRTVNPVRSQEPVPSMQPEFPQDDGQPTTGCRFTAFRLTLLSKPNTHECQTRELGTTTLSEPS